MAVASVFLLMRSFCEVVIVGQLARWPASVQTIARARDVTYGFFSVLFCFFIMMGAVPENSIARDPIVERQEVAIRQVNDWIKAHLESVTEGGEKTAPTISALLETLEARLAADNLDPQDQVVYDIKMKEVSRLKALYTNWEPVYKWQEEKENSGEGERLAHRSMSFESLDS
jgi:hypothetical protein